MTRIEYDDDNLQKLERGMRGFSTVAALYMFSPHVKPRLRLALQVHVAHALGLDRRRTKRRTGGLKHRRARPFSDQHAGSQHRPRAVLQAALVGLSQLQRLQDSGANLDAQDKNGRTAVALAARKGRADAVQRLLKLDASAYIYDNESVSPLMLASAAGHLEVVKALLLDGAADAFHVAEDGRNALMVAAAAGHSAVIEALIELGGADPNACCEESGTHPLLEAARGSHVEAARQLLQHGTKVNLTDKEGDTALLVAARSGCLPLVNLLLQHKAKSIGSFTAKQTPLHAAAARGDLGVVAALLAAGARAAVTDADGRTPAQLASSADVRHLLEAAAVNS